MTTTLITHTIGHGILTWDRIERVSDRYGSVWLMTYGDSLSLTHARANLIRLTNYDGAIGTLKAKVLDTRQSTHIGDIFHGVFPSIPTIGEIITLGTGKLFYEPAPDAPQHLSVGIRPTDGRTTLWLDIHALYRVHEQTVELFYEHETP